ncbi:conjugative transfer relaxase/helicase TraI domain-containing protein [Pantoea dispersa]|uniref:conjugative transfer relaxase/helicase TraI domain-containing protein n=1 Tax=Pantoea dispersa TaxID=59814 RepID=UPI0039BE38E6
MGKTAIGRAPLNGNGLSGAPVTARIIPPTRKYPEPHLALPVMTVPPPTDSSKTTTRWRRCWY